MKSYLLIITIVASICNGYAQFNFKPSRYHAFDIDFEAKSEQEWAGNFFIEKDRQLDSAFKISKEFDFQFRLWQVGGSNMTTSVFIMTLNNKKLSASYFHFNPHWPVDGKEMRKERVDSSRLLQLWERLLDYNILTFTSPSSETYDKMNQYKIDTTTLELYGSGIPLDIDGIGYNFELIKPLKRRTSFYQNPETYFKSYPYIKEFARATQILYLIKRYLGIPLTKPFK